MRTDGMKANTIVINNPNKFGLEAKLSEENSPRTTSNQDSDDSYREGRVSRKSWIK